MTASPLSFISIDEEELARQLCLGDFEVYSRIRPPELLNLAWSVKKLQHRAPNVLALIDRFNKISAVVTNTILKTPNVRARANVLSHWIKTMKYLGDYHNYNSLYAILAGLGNAAVSRLKWTREKVSKRLLVVWGEVEVLCSNEKSYRNYREALKMADRPCVPYIGMYLTDLTFIEDGNPNNSNNLINFSKRKLVYNGT